MRGAAGRAGEGNGGFSGHAGSRGSCPACGTPRPVGKEMTRCLDCGAERSADQCSACGLTSAAAEVLLRRGLMVRTAWVLVGAVVFLPASQLFPPLELDAILIFIGVKFFLVLGLGGCVGRRAGHHLEGEAVERVDCGFVPVPSL